MQRVGMKIKEYFFILHACGPRAVQEAWVGLDPTSQAPGQDRAGLLQPRHPAIPCSEDDPFLSLSGDRDTGERLAVRLAHSLCSAWSRWGVGLFPSSHGKGPTSSLSHDHTLLQRSWKSVPSQVGMAPRKCNPISELGRESERGCGEHW